MSQNPHAPAIQLTDIFINYRRDDTASDAGRLEHDLEQHFPDRVFRDIHDIEAGSDYMEVINETVGKCGALLVVIGRQWLTLTDKTGRRRLDDPRDPVVAEIAGALKRSNVRVIPVLMQGAEMPDEDQLPEALKDLVKKNARKISDEYWSEDVAKLVKVLEKVCGSSSQATAIIASAGRSNARETTSGKPGVMKIAIVAGVAALVAVIVLVIVLSSQVDRSKPDGQSQANVAAPANTAKPPEAAQPMKAVVNLSEKEAEFFFPFDTTVEKWTRFQETSVARKEEYLWEVKLPKQYRITIVLMKGEDDDVPVTSDFKSLLQDTVLDVMEWKSDQWIETDFKTLVKIEKTVQPDGLKITVKGEGVRRMFANNLPKEVIFVTKRPPEKGETDKSVPVEFR